MAIRMSKIRAIIMVIVLVGTAMSAIFFRDYFATRPDPSWPVVTGTVISRSLVKTAGFGNRSKLSIRIDPTGPVVYAILMMNASGQIPNSVTFRYGGDASKEVALIEETSSLVGAFIFLSIACVLVLISKKLECALMAGR
jgi:hypothetical protein